MYDSALATIDLAPPRWPAASLLPELWASILSGKGRVTRSANEANTRTLLYDLTGPSRPRHAALALSATRLASECVSTKEIAFILGLPFSTAAERASTGINLLGLRSRVELVLVTELVWLAYDRPDLAPALCQHTHIDVRPLGAASLSVSIAEPDWPDTCHLLTRAERAVVNGMLADAPHSEIARAHGTSKRTIANQVRSSYVKLGVHDRSELARAYVRRWAEVIARESSDPCGRGRGHNRSRTTAGGRTSHPVLRVQRLPGGRE